MTKVLTRRDWLRRSGLMLGGTALVGPGVMASSTPTARKIRAPIRMMYNENPYGPSRKARMTMTRAFEEGSLYAHFEASIELKEMLAKGEITEEERLKIYSDTSVSPGVCNTMGTANTMNSLTEGLGRSLPGSAAQFRAVGRFPENRKPGGTDSAQENRSRTQYSRRHGGDHTHGGAGTA